jgi:multidrug transporter EmrE-like cation transporter
MVGSGLRLDRSIAVAGLGIGGLVMVGLGAALPWITIFHGLTPVNGLSGDGAYLVGLAIGAALLGIVYLRSGRPRPLKWLAAGAAALTVIYAGFDAWRIAGYVADPGPAGPLAAPVFGPGSLVLMVGALMLLASVLLTPWRRRGLPVGMALPLLTAVSLFTAGWIHLALTGEHLDEATILGIGFLLSGVVQIALAATVALRPRGYAYFGVVAVNAAVIFLYAYAVLKGLPFGGHDHGGGLVLGSGESIDLAGAVSKAAELLSLVAAFVLLGRGAPAR